MDLTTELLDNAAFREAKRGYNTQEVDEFIEQVKVEYGRHDALIREARLRIEDAEARVAQAERRAAEAAERAEAASDADDTLKRTLVLAQRTADAAIKEAEEQAARMLSEAQEATARSRAEAESEARRAQEEARLRVAAELHELESMRNQVRADVDALERHLSEQRERVRFSTSELQRVLDDPSALRETTLPSVNEAAEPAPAEPAAEPAVVPPAEVPATPTVAPLVTPEAPAADDGPSTEMIERREGRDASDDAYLAELRKAMTDESPLGPREETAAPPLFDGPEPSRSRFGRRR